MLRSLLNRREAATFLTETGFPVAYATLAKLACQGGGPLFVRYGSKPLYRPDDLIAWAVDRSRTCRSTSDAGHPLAEAYKRRQEMEALHQQVERDAKAARRLARQEAHRLRLQLKLGRDRLWREGQLRQGKTLEDPTQITVRRATRQARREAARNAVRRVGLAPGERGFGQSAQEE